MSKKWAFLFPGQGAQYPGMAKDFYDQFAVARRTFEEADSCLNTAFSKLVFEGPAHELTLTKNSQVAIYIASIAILRTVQEQFPEIQPVVSAGLSLGEYTALTATGRIAFADCLQLVYLRALYMHEACEINQGGMQVILGLDAETVEEVVESLGSSHSVWVANLNCPGQVVIAGTLEGMQVAVEILKQKGAKRALPLDVSGAFHSGLMLSAKEKLAPHIRSVPLQDSLVGLVMNVPGDYVAKCDQTRGFLLDQVTSPVRWEKGIRAMMTNHIDIYLEMGPGKTLSGMNKRIGVTQPTCSVEKVADLEALSQLMEAYAVAER